MSHIRFRPFCSHTCLEVISPHSKIACHVARQFPWAHSMLSTLVARGIGILIPASLGWNCGSVHPSSTRNKGSSSMRARGAATSKSQGLPASARASNAIRVRGYELPRRRAWRRKTWGDGTTEYIGGL